MSRPLDRPTGGSVRPTSEAFRHGEPGALRDLYERCGPRVHGLAVRALGPDRAEDVTQQVFISAWSGRKGFDPERGDLEAWVFGIARRKVVDAVRVDVRRRETSVDPATLSDAPSSTSRDRPSTLDDDVADRLLVAEAVASLRDPQRRILRMAFYEELSQPEIAAQLDMALGTVKSHVRRGLMSLRKRMEVTDDPQ